jgi:hypothetical protein
MATKARLEQALRNADAAGDVEAAKAFANAIRSGQYDDAQQAPQEQPQEKNLLQKAGDVALEGMAGVNRGAAGLVDFATSPINAGLELAGSNARIPSAVDALAPATTGNFMQDGLGKDITRAAGETVPAALAMGGALRAGAQALPQMGRASESVGAGALRQMGGSTAGQDAGYAALSGAGSAVGQELGGDAGAIAGAIAAPLAGAGIMAGAKGVVAAAKSAFDDWKNPAPVLSKATTERNRIITEALDRSGMKAGEAEKELAALGENGTLADLSPAFSRQLKAAMSENPQLEGAMQRSFGERSKGAYSRLTESVSKQVGQGDDIDGTMAALEKSMQPKIAQLYDDARATPFEPSDRLKGLLRGNNPLAEASKEAAKSIETKRALGDTDLGQLTLMDETKRVLDGKIGMAKRSGNNTEVRDLTRLKNFMVEEVDKVSPEYKAARSLFAGKESLKEAAELGEAFLKTNANDVKMMTKSFGESEKHFYKLGAQRAILNKLDTTNLSSDASKAILGKNGDVAKIRSLFTSQKEFDDFADVIAREGKFKQTANAIFGNSTTAKQAADIISLREGANAAMDAVSNPVGAASTLGRIVGSLRAKKGTEDFKRGLLEAGMILGERGMDNKRLFTLLKKQEGEVIAKALALSQKKIKPATKLVPMLIGTQQERQPQEAQ